MLEPVPDGPMLRLIEERCRGGARRLRLAGELDLATGECLRAAARRCRLARCERFELDLDQVTFVDLSGARALAEFVRDIEDVGGCVVVLPGRALARLVRLSGLDRELQLV